MDGSLRDVTSKGWRNRLFGTFIALQALFVLSLTVFSGRVVRPSSQFRPGGMSEADEELYYSMATSEDLNFGLYSLVDYVMIIISLVFVAYAVCYLLSWKKMSRRERVVMLETIAVFCVIYAAVVAYFRNYDGLFRMYMNLLPAEISALMTMALYFIQKKFRRKEPELDAPITEAGE